ncbi:MAG: hypothetical protein IAG10_00570 [Planctomycetaceae bacterium]|nr:hypothetical protein [Planctomycetaceae bacterium]
MSIRISCDSCGKQLKVRDEAAGRRVKCPDCGSVVQIPEPDDVMDAEAADDNPFAGGDISSDGAEYDRKPCPACGEMIVKTAAKCRYCGEIFDPALKKKAKAKSRRSSGGYADDGDDMSTGDWVAALICSGIGCIAGIVWMIQGKPKGTKMFLVSLGMFIFWNIVSFAIQVAKNPQLR